MNSDNSSHGFPKFPQAEYTPNPLASLAGNPLVEALKRTRTKVEWLDALAISPGFGPHLRVLSDTDRTISLFKLRDFFVPFQRHARLCSQLDAMLLYGYTGRGPETKEHMQTAHSLHSDFGAALQNPQHKSFAPAASVTLTGPSGMGKTTFIKNWIKYQDEVIYHPKYNIYQIPVLIIKTPSGGVSTIALCGKILLKLDKLLKVSNYYKNLLRKTKLTEFALLTKVASLLNEHYVGMIVFDEIQRIANSITSKIGKGQKITQPLLSLFDNMVTLCDALHIPMLFIGTDDANTIFQQSLILARRVTGVGSHQWDRLRGGGMERLL